jgi:DnaK suppressor protein
MAKTISNKPLTKAQLGHYKQILEDKAIELRRNMSTPVAATIVARREEPVDVADLSTQSHEEWLFLNRNSLDVSLLRQIKEALIRIEDQSYGICQDCGTPISTKRLEAVPWATYCVRCQDAHSFSHNAWEN